MTVLYSRVVYSLWFKREESELENTRQVQYERSIAYIRKEAKENKHVKNRIVKCDANLIYSGHAHSYSSSISLAGLQACCWNKGNKHSKRQTS